MTTKERMQLRRALYDFLADNQELMGLRLCGEIDGTREAQQQTLQIERLVEHVETLCQAHRRRKFLHRRLKVRPRPTQGPAQ